MIRTTRDEDVKFRHMMFSYTARGHYAHQLRRWFLHFPRERFLVLCSEEFFADPGPALDRAFRPLGLPSAKLGRFDQHNPTDATKPPEHLQARLVTHFESHNAELAELTGTSWPWSRAR